ncbi:MAG: hypothetical protein HOV73_25225 [Streptomyces sp.]|nr:hypothetical protein [Streptomyces sp.]
MTHPQRGLQAVLQVRGVPPQRRRFVLVVREFGLDPGVDLCASGHHSRTARGVQCRARAIRTSPATSPGSAG